MQIRNSDDQGNDFILSPVIATLSEANGEAIHFDSRKRYAQTENELPNSFPMPTSGDANGAFNIARKGLMMLKRISENPEKPNLFVSDEERDESVGEIL